jgi:hypothetical protein
LGHFLVCSVAPSFLGSTDLSLTNSTKQIASLSGIFRSLEGAWPKFSRLLDGQLVLSTAISSLMR